MLAILSSLASLVAKKSKASASQHRRSGSVPPFKSRTISHPVLSELSEGLEQAARLLVTPDPQSIRTVTFIIRNAGIRLNQLKNVEMDERSRDDLQRVHEQLRRTRSLVEGAMRIQWTSIRRLMALTQSYAPPGRVSCFNHRWPRVDVKV